MPANPAVGHGLRVRQARAAEPADRCGADVVPDRRGAAGGRRGARAVAATAAARRATVQGLPLIKPPYDRITAYDMNTGDLIWQKTHSSTPDEITKHPALKGLNLPRLGQPGRTFIGVLATKTLLDRRGRRCPHQ